MRYAVFFRNVNLGRGTSPGRELLERAFADAGAGAPASFQVNGTLAFDARSDAAAARIVDAASRTLTEACGLAEPAFLRRLDALAALVAAAPFERRRADDVYECCVSFLHAALPPLPADLAFATPRGDLELFGYDAGCHAVLSLSRKVGASPGSPNALLELRLGLPATTRNWGTISRLVARFAA